MQVNLSTYQKLAALENPIRVGVAGAGEFGRELVSQISFIRNMEVSAVADIRPEAAIGAFLAAGYSRDDIAEAQSAQEALKLMESGKRVVVEDAMLLCALPLAALCDVTGDPCFGAEFAYRAIECRKHVIVVNIESDVVTGAILRRLADQAGVVYTEADGDQPSLIKGLCDWAALLGLEVFAAGKWTHVTPGRMQREEGKRTDVGFDDGSKNQVEMGCVANMTGLVPDVRGMHMPSLRMEEILNAFDLRRAGGILGGKGVVDAVNCLTPDGETEVEPLLGGGVFIIIATENPIARQVLRDKGFLHNSDASHALIYRPFHFVGIEAPASIARAVLYGEPTGSPLPSPVADVIAVAKRNLQPGEALDGIGGCTVRGLVERAAAARKLDALPLGLAEKVRVKGFVPKGTILTYDMLEEPGSSFIWKLRGMQDQLCWQMGMERP